MRTTFGPTALFGVVICNCTTLAGPPPPEIFYVKPADRTVEVAADAFCFEEGCTDADQADETAPIGHFHFETSVGVNASAGTGSGAATATQASTLNTIAIFGAGTATGSGNGDLMGAGGGVGESRIDVTFQLTDNLDFLLSGLFSKTVDQGFDFNTASSMKLTDVASGMDLVDVYLDSNTCPLPGCAEVILNESGSLQGWREYRLVVIAHAEGSGGSGIGSQNGSAGFEFKLGFSAPFCCPSDTNCDGFIDIDDLINVILDWGCFGGCPGDVNFSDTVDVDDLIQVITDWGGC